MCPGVPPCQGLAVLHRAGGEVRLWTYFKPYLRSSFKMSNPFLWLVLTILDLYMWVVIIGVILSWLVSFKVVNTSNRFVYMVGDLTYRLTEPALGRIRRYIPNLGGLDISPVVLIILLIFLQRFIVWGYNEIG